MGPNDSPPGSPQAGLSEANIEALRNAFGLHMDSLGRFWKDGECFEHPGIVNYLRQHIEAGSVVGRDHDSPWVIDIEGKWVPLAVENDPIRVRTVSFEYPDEADAPPPASIWPRLALDDGRKLWLDTETLDVDRDDHFICNVQSASGRSTLRAGFRNPAALQLAQRIEDLDTTDPKLCLVDPRDPPGRTQRIQLPRLARSLSRAQS